MFPVVKIKCNLCKKHISTLKLINTNLLYDCSICSVALVVVLYNEVQQGLGTCGLSCADLGDTLF